MSDTASTATGHRKRDKPQLSCNACRKRKYEILPTLSNCASRGLGSTCTFAAISSPTNMPPSHGHSIPVQHRVESARPGPTNSMQTRINQLENLVIELMNQNNTPGMRTGLQNQGSDARSDARCQPTPLSSETEFEYPVAPSPSDHGSINTRLARPTYVSSSHWAAIFDSITELRNHFVQEDIEHGASTVLPSSTVPKPQILYGAWTSETPHAIISSLPPRTTVDRLISRYFNVLDIAPGVVHSTQFLREYENFWMAPQDAPIMWVGLLFAMMCLSAQLQQASLPAHDSRPSSSRASQQDSIAIYREKTIQCLQLGHYTMGGTHALETLILYFLGECFNLKDMEIGIWILSGTILQIAIHMGYHRDAKNFPSITPFAGEMRRRVWAMIVQLDFSISAQLGLPTLIKASQTDTAEPRNLYDTDFDEDSSALPESRPETEVTPTLYVLAKLRLISIGLRVTNVASESRTRSYSDVLELDRQLREARDALPSSLKWIDLGTSLNVSSQTILQRIWLEVTIQQLTIVLHKKFLGVSGLQKDFKTSRAACLNAAVKILELQRLVDDETQPDGLLYQSRWRVSSAFSNDFLLATSILCYCLQNRPEGTISNFDESVSVGLDQIRALLETSKSIWSRQCAESKEAHKAVAALRYVLGHSGADVDSGYTVAERQPLPMPTAALSYFPDLTSDYNFAGFDFGSSDTTRWTAFASDELGEENWSRGAGFQQMDMSLKLEAFDRVVPNSIPSRCLS
nr:C6 transcription factor [Pyrenochaetopsis sp.]